MPWPLKAVGRRQGDTAVAPLSQRPFHTFLAITPLCRTTIHTSAMAAILIRTHGEDGTSGQLEVDWLRAEYLDLKPSMEVSNLSHSSISLAILDSRWWPLRLPGELVLACVVGSCRCKHEKSFQI